MDEADAGAKGWHGIVMREQRHSSGECSIHVPDIKVLVASSYVSFA